MIVTVLLLILVISFFVHIVYLALYVLYKGKKFLNRFLVTFVLNISLMTVVMVFALRKPGNIQTINMGFFLWLLSGIIFFVLFALKVSILRRIYKRSKDPRFFHCNYFGRKVYNRGVIRKSEFYIIIGQTPIFLLMGAYFFGKLINILLDDFSF
jgi:hypothetical protein